MLVAVLNQVKRGKHGFEVQAVDAGGNLDPTPAAHAWKVKRKKRKRSERAIGGTG